MLQAQGLNVMYLFKCQDLERGFTQAGRQEQCRQTIDEHLRGKQRTKWDFQQPVATGDTRSCSGLAKGPSPFWLMLEVLTFVSELALMTDHFTT